GAVAQARRLDDHVDRRGDHLADGAARQRIAAHGDHRFEARHRLARAVGVQRPHRAVVTGIHRLQQVERFRSAHFADDDPLRTHTQAVLDEVAHGDLALALEIGRTVSRRTTCGCCNCSSAESSQVITRSSFSMKAVRQLSSVVLPEPVPPEISTLARTRPRMRSTSAPSGEIELYLTSCWRVSLSFLNFRMVSAAPSIDSGGAMTLTREPSGRRASQIGELSSTRRPTCDTMRWQTFIRWLSSRKRTLVSFTLPPTSM